MGRAASIAQAKFGFPTQAIVNPVTSSVLTSATRVLLNNPDRVFWLIINLSGNRGYLGFDRQVASTLGLPIEGNGGFWSADIDEDGESVAYEVFSVNNVATGTYYILEVVAK